MAKSEQKSDYPSLKAFNATGNDDTTTEVLSQQYSPEARKRNVTLIGIVVAALALLLYVAYQRSGLSLIPSADDNHASIGASAEKAAKQRTEE